MSAMLGCTDAGEKAHRPWLKLCELISDRLRPVLVIARSVATRQSPSDTDLCVKISPLRIITLDEFNLCFSLEIASYISSNNSK